MATTAPTSQKHLRVSFALADGDKGLDFLTLPINPEDLTRSEPSRTFTVNSLDGAWIDSFGRGLAQITIAGNTGWRNRNNVGDGIYQFELLRDQFIHAWHTLRSEKIANGKDPNDVRLIFIDPSSGKYVADVAPINFTLRRSRAQPLLLNYNLTLSVVRDKASNPYKELEEPISPKNDLVASKESMLSSIGKISELQKSLRSALAKIGEFAKSVSAWTANTFGPVMNLAKDIIQTVKDAKAVISAAAQVAIDLARDLSAVGAQLWAAVAAVASLPNAVLAQVMQIKREFTNLFCVLSNGFKAAYQAESFDYLYGSSNCSSTLGGWASALTSDNAFDTGQTPGAMVQVSDRAAAAVQDVKRMDPIEPINAIALRGAVDAMNGGVVVA